MVFECWNTGRTIIRVKLLKFEQLYDCYYRIFHFYYFFSPHFCEFIKTKIMYELNKEISFPDSKPYFN